MSLELLQQEIDQDERPPVPDFMSGEMHFVNANHLEAELESQQRRVYFLSTSPEELAQGLSDLSAMYQNYILQFES